MLDTSCEASALAEQIAQLPCNILLPAQWADAQSRHGQTHTEFDEVRRHPRFSCAGSQTKVALEYSSTLPAYPREPLCYGTFVTNIARGGLAFLHSEPLYPSEKMNVVFPNGGRRAIKIAWVHRIQERCFEIGASFLGELE